ncbi:bifunctional DNA-formamidopyrimidine glycosylase/DNA-(apurinic or apyrimidinic site) lyase [Teredinibacter purpureus]|uniref:bifunctional DNA-formamidopyrimidine glycosylase/DNA-(apurinic or apyrimidinic site) lyase n=1 Tax=Teredinibacter purpureus TaxID=2731756 RepID=UPI0005F7C4BC|nr:bifunctional DNA-formamidopyrimidine glycosylase/DNA-(apurinic or apyrimidinic site) lyase [Teredinibacter purpureus]
MPELPEVETTRAGILAHLAGQHIKTLVIRNPNLRWPVPLDISALTKGTRIENIARRGKYLLFQLSNQGTLIWHLGMSGSMRIDTNTVPPGKHDHIDLVTRNGTTLRYNDPRRFGSLHYTEEPADTHPLLSHLGPEPLTLDFNSDYLFKRSRKRSLVIKTLIMDSKVVVGVGNIYANEALFNAGIHPLKPAGKISKLACEKLTKEIKYVLTTAIKQGGTTLRDFTNSDGKPGYFSQQLKVYGRAGEPCIVCGKSLIEKRVSQRATVYCTRCQR